MSSAAGHPKGIAHLRSVLMNATVPVTAKLDVFTLGQKEKGFLNLTFRRIQRQSNARHNFA
jgi:hypothetical protein